MAAFSTIAGIGGGLLGAAGSIIGGNKQSKATQQAADISAQNNAANLRFAEQARAQNAAALQPYMNIGQQVNPLIAQLLGYGGNPAQAQAGLNTFRNATGFQDQMLQGQRAVNTNAATSGLLNSGATLQALQERGQNMAAGSFGNYLNALIGQQGTGLNAAGSLAGVNNAYTGQVIGANNMNAGNQANATLANAAVRSNQMSNLLGSVGGVLQGFGGSGALGAPNYGLGGIY